MLCAEGASIDRFTNNASVFNIIETINFENFPGVFKMVVLVTLSREPGDPAPVDGTIRLSMGDTELLRGPHTMDFQRSKLARAVLTVQGLVIPRPGQLKVTFQVSGRDVGEWWIECIGRSPQIQLPLEDQAQAAI
jgi:hypothetical protein